MRGRLDGVGALAADAVEALVTLALGLGPPRTRAAPADRRRRRRAGAGTVHLPAPPDVGVDPMSVRTPIFGRGMSGTTGRRAGSPTTRTRTPAGPVGPSTPAGPDWEGAVDLPCRADPEAWFADHVSAQTMAAVTCRTRCPLVARCRALALAELPEFGVWGGMTKADRDEEMGGARPPRFRPLRCGHHVSDIRYRASGGRWCVTCDRERARARYVPTPAVAAVAGPVSDRVAAAAARRERIMAGYALLAPRRLPRAAAAAELGVSVNAFKGIYRRALGDGDRRAVPHRPPAGHGTGRVGVAS